MSQEGKIYGVAIGPGDPELITVKGLVCLQNADLIFYPASEVSIGKQHSYSLSILEQMNLETPMLPLHIPMSGKNREMHYQKAFEQIKCEYDKGKNIAVVSEGDLLFYSTFGYLLKLIKASSMDFELIPGVPAFIAAGSQGDQPIVEGNQQLKVIARPDSFEQIQNGLQEQSTLVVMKMSVLNGWSDFLQKIGKSFFYIEKIGTNEQFSTSEVVELKERTIPYFSIIIIYG